MHEGRLTFKGELEAKLITAAPQLTRWQRFRNWKHGKFLDWKIAAGVEPRGRHTPDWRARPKTLLGWIYCRVRGKL